MSRPLAITMTTSRAVAAARGLFARLIGRVLIWCYRYPRAVLAFFSVLAALILGSLGLWHISLTMRPAERIAAAAGIAVGASGFFISWLAWEIFDGLRWPEPQQRPHRRSL